jgi:hypothetical protein
METKKRKQIQGGETPENIMMLCSEYHTMDEIEKPE